MFVTLGVLHTKRIRRIILSSVTCLPLPYFSTLSYRRYEFRKTNFIEYKVCFDFSTIFSETLRNLRRNGLGFIKNIKRYSCKALVILVRFSWNLNFLGWFSKKSMKFHEIPSSGSLVLPCGQMDGWRDMKKLSLLAILLKLLTHSLPYSTLVDLTFQSRALRSFSLNQLRNLSL